MKWGFSKRGLQRTLAIVVGIVLTPLLPATRFCFLTTDFSTYIDLKHEETKIDNGLTIGNVNLEVPQPPTLPPPTV